MKKILSLAIALTFQASLMGQGIIFFANNNLTRVSTNFLETVGVQSATPIGTWYYALFRAPSTKNSINTGLDPLFDGWTLVAIGTNTTSSGRLSGNTTTEGVVVTPTGPSTDDYAVAGWSGNIGSSWAAVEAFFGNQPVFDAIHFGSGGGFVSGTPFFGIAPTIADNIIAQPTGSAINGVFGTIPGTIQGFQVAYLDPEPSSASILSLGAVIAVLWRRKRQGNGQSAAHCKLTRR